MMSTWRAKEMSQIKGIQMGAGLAIRMTAIDKLTLLLAQGKGYCEQYSLIEIVTADGVRGDKVLSDSDSDYFDHKFTQQYQMSEDSYHGFECIPIDDNSEKYFVFEFFN